MTIMRSLRQQKMRTTPLSVAMSLDEREAVQTAADLQGETVSAFIRTAAVRSARGVIAKQTPGEAA